MRVEEQYDLIVIGDQLSGLFLAAGAAQQGKKVLVLEESSFPTVLYEVPSGKLLGDYMAEPAIGLQEGSPVDAFLKSLGLYQEIGQLFPVHEPPFQLVSQGLRMDFNYSPESLARELLREVQLPVEKLDKLKRLLSGEMVCKKSFRDAVAEAGLEVEFEVLGPLQAALYGSVLRDDLPYPHYRELMVQCARGVRFPMGGRGALKERLLARIQIVLFH
jgi:phytoene dehydrogenase-like protein